MSLSTQLNDLLMPAFRNNWRKFLAWGIALVIVGLLAISAATFTTMLSVIFMGFIIFFSGAIITIDTFTFWWGKWSGFLLHLFIGLMYAAVGLMLIQNPMEGSVSLTLLLGVFYIVIGLSRIGISTSIRLPKWRWSLLNGVITLVLGVLILTNWPQSSLFIIGLFVGIDLFFCGWTYIMAAMAARKYSTRR